MRLRTETIGVLNLFGVRPGPLSDADGRVVHALAHVATIAILQQRALTRSRVVREQLRSRSSRCRLGFAHIDLEPDGLAVRGGGDAPSVGQGLDHS
jgi:GAF domain-containing protein